MFNSTQDRQRAYKDNPRVPKKSYVKAGAGRAMRRYNSTKSFRTKKTK